MYSAEKMNQLKANNIAFDTRARCYLYEGALVLNMAHMHHLAELWAKYLRGSVLALIQGLLVYVN